MVNFTRILKGHFVSQPKGETPKKHPEPLWAILYAQIIGNPSIFEA
jgi:hypothetical protein